MRCSLELNATSLEKAGKGRTKIGNNMRIHFIRVLVCGTRPKPGYLHWDVNLKCQHAIPSI